jgi:hypothetical protein
MPPDHENKRARANAVQMTAEARDQRVTMRGMRVRVAAMRERLDRFKGRRPG